MRPPTLKGTFKHLVKNKELSISTDLHMSVHSTSFITWDVPEKFNKIEAECFSTEIFFVLGNILDGAQVLLQILCSEIILLGSAYFIKHAKAWIWIGTKQCKFPTCSEFTLTPTWIPSTIWISSGNYMQQWHSFRHSSDNDTICQQWHSYALNKARSKGCFLPAPPKQEMEKQSRTEWRKHRAG